ncbi:hypothetical protein BS78_06G074000 [Paspalum vaginatum]|nr:hypothetical protein BS78_06G074000 [Paspalum vaginatum]
MEYSTQGHNLYPHAQPQPGLYPPPPPPEQEGYQQYQYQGYLGGAADRARGWSEQAAPLSDDADAGRRPFHYHYQDDADCITFLRGCLAGLCCCVLLEQCCCL